MDKRRRQYVPIAVTMPFSKTGTKLKARFGRDGLLIWTLYLISCKTNWIQGQLTYTSEVDGWSKLGLYPDQPPDVTLEEFFTYTGQLKQTRRRRSGDVTDVVCTHWQDWNDEITREFDADKKARKRASNTPTLDGHSADDTPTLGGTELEVEVEIEEEPEVEGRGDSPPANAGGRPPLRAVSVNGWTKPTADEIQRVKDLIPKSLRKGTA